MNDKRMALCVIDLKNITEANASYSAEVCLYAMFLSNWLHSAGKAFLKNFFVSDRVYLWRHIEMPRFTKIMGTKEGGDHAKRLSALQDNLCRVSCSKATNKAGRAARNRVPFRPATSPRKIVC